MNEEVTQSTGKRRKMVGRKQTTTSVIRWYDTHESFHIDFEKKKTVKNFASLAPNTLYGVN